MTGKVKLFCPNIHACALACRWNQGTIGYHGDDGRLYWGTAVSERCNVIGPLYSTGDVVGVGLHHGRGHVLFT